MTRASTIDPKHGGNVVPADGLYERDVLAWSEQQAALLRRLATGERLEAAVDWGNVIDEVETVGRSELHACESLLRQALVHLLKQRAWPSSRSVAHWRAEIEGFLFSARRSYAPSMRQRIALDEIYQSALRQVRVDNDDAGQPQPLPDVCPFTLDELLAADSAELLQVGPRP